MRRRKRIFRPKRRYRIRRRNGNTIKIITSIAAVAVLVFIGYSAAGPVSRFLESRTEQEQTEPWTPDDTDIPPAETSDTAVSEQSAVSVGDTQPAASAEEQTAQTEAPTSEIRSGGAAYSVPVSAMADRESLEAVLEELYESGCSAAVFPMKTEGGIFNYATAIPFANTAKDGEDPIKSELTAEEIASLSVQHGLRPVALVSVLADNNRYGDYREGSYRSLDGSTWLDTSPEKGGKPWLSPFDATAQEYLCDIMTELADAGFGEIIADDFIFPEFRSSDIELLGEGVSPYSDRYLALTSLASMLTEAGSESGAQVMLRITANSVIKGYSELFHPEELYGCTIMVDFSENNIASTMVSGGEEIILSDMDENAKVTAVFAEVSYRCGELATVPMIERESMSADDYNATVSAITAMGYDGYYVY